MKKNIILFAGLVLVCGVGFYYLNSEDQKENSEVTPAVTAKNEKISARSTLRKSKYIPSQPLKASSIFPTTCDSSLKDILNMTIEDYMETIQNQKGLEAFFGDTCFNELSQNETYKKITQGLKCDSKKNCMAILIFLKALYISDQTKDIDLSKLSSQELAAHVVKAFTELDSINKEKFEKNSKLLETLMNLHPDDMDVREAYLGYLMVGKQITSHDGFSDKVDELLESGKGTSFKFDRMEVIKVVIDGNYSKAKEALDRLEKTYPQEPEVAYYRASYYWKTGNKELARQFLDKAIAMGENCSYCSPGTYQETKAKMQKAKDNEQVFSLSIGLNFDNL